jgi:Ca2+:H+ antiporter
VALMVIPVLVIAGWVMDKPMDINFPTVEVVLFFLAVMTTAPVLISGSSNWLHGSLLLTCYLFIAFAMWHEEGTVADWEGEIRM